MIKSKWTFFLFYCSWLIILITREKGFVFADNLALLSGTLRTYQKAACENEWMSLNCPRGTTISIQFAQYARVTQYSLKVCRKSLGISKSQLNSSSLAKITSLNTTCVWPASFQYALLQKVVGLCQKQKTCRFQTSPETFAIESPNPCPGTKKFVEIAYKCRPSEFRNLIGCDDEVIHLKCNASTRIAIYSANYGRTEYESVKCPQPNGVGEETCLASYATETVMQLCHGKRRCTLAVDAVTFTNPCKFPLSRKYLKIIYTCLPRRVLKDKYQGEAEMDEILSDSELDENDESEDEIEENNNEEMGVFQVESSLVEQNGQPIGNDELTDNPSNDEISTSNESENLWNYSIEASNRTSEQSESKKGVEIVHLISQGIAAYHYITKNSEKFYLYLAICFSICFLLLLIIISVKVAMSSNSRQKNRKNRVNKNDQKSSLYDDRGGCGGLGEYTTDELSLVYDPEINLNQTDPDKDRDRDSISDQGGFDLVSILKRPDSAGSRAFDHFSSRSPINSCSTSSTFHHPNNNSNSTNNSNNNRIVRFSNSPKKHLKNDSKRGSGIYIYDPDPDLSPPKSLKYDGQKGSSQNNLHFFYDG